VHAIVVADGAGSRYPDELMAKLEKDARRAAEVIGFASLKLLALPDQRLDTVPLIELTQLLERELDHIDPGVVYTHFPGDVNVDHGLVARAAWTACRPYYRPGLRRFAVFETPSSTEWAWPLDGAQFQPNLFVDVTATLDIKIAAMECYESELRDYPHPRSGRALRERAAFWGSQVGLPAAEPFRILREMG
jgi:LmbE family N-acetylglucosaminyl deacetylase